MPANASRDGIDPDRGDTVHSAYLHIGVLTAACFVPLIGAAASEPATEQPLLRELAAAVRPADLNSTVSTLVSFGTRHTLSETHSDSRGIGAARRWVQRRFADLSSQCDNCLEVVTPSQTFSGPRVPQPTEVMDIVAIQRGSGDANRVILITGHLD